MISKEKAIELVTEDLADTVGIDPDEIVEKEYGWVMFPRSKAFSNSRDLGPPLVGSGGILVLRENGKKIKFGSYFPLETHLRIYELGYMDHASYDIVITKIHNEQATITNLMKLEIKYVIPEFEHGVTWVIPTPYTGQQLTMMLRKQLPLRLTLGGLYFRWERLEELKNQSAFEYTLEENKGHVNSI